MKIITNSERETYDFAYNFAKEIKDNEVICLNGDLGAGKTVFVRGFAKYFGINETSSPTFAIVNEYNGDRDIYHFDVYRLSDEEEFYNIGGEEYFDRGICIIEWSHNIVDALPPKRIEITIEKIDDTTREINVDRL